MTKVRKWLGGFAVVEAERRALFVLVAILSIAQVWTSAALVNEAQRSDVRPFIIQVDETKRGSFVGEAKEYLENDPENEIVKSELLGWLETVRWIVREPNAQQLVIDQAERMVTGRATAYINRFHARPEHNPLVIGRRASREVVRSSILRRSEGVYFADWIEVLKPEFGPWEYSQWNAVITVQLMRPSSGDDIRRNPLGVQIVEIDWNQTTAATPTQTQLAR